MKLAIAVTGSNDPEVHKQGCADIRRGLRTGKYEGQHLVELAALEDAANWFWADFLPGGCAYGESEPAMTVADAQSYTKYLPCTKEAE